MALLFRLRGDRGRVFVSSRLGLNLLLTRLKSGFGASWRVSRLRRPAGRLGLAFIPPPTVSSSLLKHTLPVRFLSLQPLETGPPPPPPPRRQPKPVSCSSEGGDQGGKTPPLFSLNLLASTPDRCGGAVSPRRR